MSKKSGITLIALIITIIVMLILVAVTITMAVNGGLFGYAGNAASETKTALEDEKNLGDGSVETTIDGHTFSSIEDIDQYVKNGTVPVTAEDILRFINDSDVCMNGMAHEFTEKLKWMGGFSGLTYEDSEWSNATVYRCSINDKIYIVGTKVGQAGQTVEILDWDGTVTLGNDDKPATLSLSFGTYQRGNSSNEGEFSLQVGAGDSYTELYICPYFSGGCILLYDGDGWLIEIQWM